MNLSEEESDITKDAKELLSKFIERKDLFIRPVSQMTGLKSTKLNEKYCVIFPEACLIYSIGISPRTKLLEVYDSEDIMASYKRELLMSDKYLSESELEESHTLPDVKYHYVAGDANAPQYLIKGPQEGYTYITLAYPFLPNFIITQRIFTDTPDPVFIKGIKLTKRERKDFVPRELYFWYFKSMNPQGPNDTKDLYRLVYSDRSYMIKISIDCYKKRYEIEELVNIILSSRISSYGRPLSARDALYTKDRIERCFYATYTKLLNETDLLQQLDHQKLLNETDLLQQLDHQKLLNRSLAYDDMSPQDDESQDINCITFRNARSLLCSIYYKEIDIRRDDYDFGLAYDSD